MSITPLQAAKNICELGHWKVSNLSLQKILYFCHMVYMGRNEGKFLLDESFEAWMYGPVLPSLYHTLKIFGSKHITNSFSGVEDILEDDTRSFLAEVGGALLKRDPWDLVTLTHTKEGAWAKNYEPYCQREISNKDILEEYKVFNERYQ